MTDQPRVPKAPISAQPTSTTVPGLQIETGFIRDALSNPQEALEVEDRRTFRRTVPTYDDLEALREICQRPDGSMPLKRHYDGGEISDFPEWTGLRVEIIAFELTPTIGLAGDSSIRVPLGHPWVYHEFPGIDGPCIIARWLHRYPGHPGVLEVAWDGARLFATQVRRSVHFLGPGGAEDAVRLLALWVTDDAGWPQRPRLRWAVLAAVTVDMMIARFLELEGAAQRRPSQDDLARSYSIARSAFTRWLEDQRLTWSGFLAKVPSRA